MSELMNFKVKERNFRWQLLATVSAAVLMAAGADQRSALAADDAEHPTVWIELGGQLEQINEGQQAFSPPFVANLPNNFFSPLKVQKPLRQSFGGEGMLSFEPNGSDWVFSAAVRFGRSNGVRQQHQQTANAKFPVHFTVLGKYYNKGVYYPSSHVKFEDAKTSQSATHAVLDFQVGKDIGIGLFGKNSSSVFSGGLRFAQFNSKSTTSLHALPDLHYPSAPITTYQEKYALKNIPMDINFHAYSGLSVIQRNFRGIGPSLSWKASAPVVGNPEGMGVALDWGVNGAVLFGRQKVTGSHQTTVRSYHKSLWQQALLGAYEHNTGLCGHPTVCIPGAFKDIHLPISQAGLPNAQHSTGGILNRSRSVFIPNLGGFAGISVRYPNAKLSVGYRADFFFGAVDGGMATRKSEDIGFFGPYASISIGLGG
jgi:iron complex outermembrane receptor protein